MSSKTAIRTVNVKIRDESASQMLAVARVATSLARELNMLKMAYEALADSELLAEAAGGDFVAMATLAVRALGVFAGGARVGAAAGLAAGGGVGIVPVGQTRAGEVRMLTSSGPVWGHKGETLGRLTPPSPAKSGAAGLTVQVQQMNLVRDGEDPESVGRTFSRMRSGMLSSDIPAS